MKRAQLRRPSWPRAGTIARGGQSAPAVLERLGRRIADNAPEAIRRRMDVAYADPQRDGYAPAPGGDRAWRVAEADGIVWCITDLASQSALLEAVLGGPGAARPTSIERAIVAETIERLFRCDDLRGDLLDECERERPINGDWWRCNVDLTPRKGRSATLQLFAPRSAEERSSHAAAERPDLRTVPIPMSVELAPVPVSVADILEWSPGTIVALPRWSLTTAIAGASPDNPFASGRVGSIIDSAGETVRAFEIASIHRGLAS